MYICQTIHTIKNAILIFVYSLSSRYPIFRPMSSSKSYLLKYHCIKLNNLYYHLRSLSLKYLANLNAINLLHKSSMTINVSKLCRCSRREKTTTMTAIYASSATAPSWVSTTTSNIGRKGVGRK